MSEHGFNSSNESREKSLKIICKSSSENKEFIKVFQVFGFMWQPYRNWRKYTEIHSKDKLEMASSDVR